MIISDKRILEFVEYLKSVGKIRFDTEFYTPIGMTKFVFSQIKNQDKDSERQTRHFTAEHIRLICEIFKVDANYIFGFSDKPYNSRKLKVTSTVTSG
ncbi:hypothetical protein [Chryseobacterium sp. EO14]|uniref:hypothetical protein n=1 Tax=Chryseobacterium sp. EO14 TaxID=2950551 RepID=UPI00210A79FB|nr:hypothetical protein [Chryseobacterium sp. EO14]MCQ4139186.1 hypothetical protein [Chryseobacterium sp. EO14]